MTNSSNAALPALSPSPLIVTCAQDAPAWNPAMEFATANPKSLWQCTLTGNPVTSATSDTSLDIYCGVEPPTVSGISILSAPVSATDLNILFKNCISDLVASSAENSTTNPCFLAYSTA